MRRTRPRALELPFELTTSFSSAPPPAETSIGEATVVRRRSPGKTRVLPRLYPLLAMVRATSASDGRFGSAPPPPPRRCRRARFSLRSTLRATRGSGPDAPAAEGFASARRRHPQITACAGADVYDVVIPIDQHLGGATSSTSSWWSLPAELMFHRSRQARQAYEPLFANDQVRRSWAGPIIGRRAQQAASVQGVKKRRGDFRRLDAPRNR